jgi:porphobilinogen synthase
MNAGFPEVRPRRLRGTRALRTMVAETSLRPAQLVLPVFIKEGIDEPQPISSMPGVMQHTRDSLRKAAADAVEAGAGGIIVFGVPEDKDDRGSGADDPEGISQLAIADIRAEAGDDLVIMADLCLCEYTDHGHCGIVTPAGYVDNDLTLQRYASTAVAQAEAGAHMVAPSGMMDGQVGVIRKALDAAGYQGLPICAYSAKYASAFYGPFREAAEGAPKFGDRATHQQDPANVLEALREVELDLAEGADMVMVKPALSYLDVIRRVADAVTVPVAAYQVSGEFAMVEAAAANGWVDRDKAIMETLTAIRRAGASIILTYWATEVARALALSGGRLGKRQCGGGQAHLPHRLADRLRRRSGLVGKATDLGDGMLVGRGLGDEVQVPVIQVRYPERVLPVPERGSGRDYLTRVALQRGDPGLDRVLGEPQGTLLRPEDRVCQGPGARGRVELVLGPQFRDVAQGDRDLPLVRPQRRLRHDVRGLHRIASDRVERGVDGVLGPDHQLAARPVQGRGHHELVAVTELIQRLR